MLTLLLFKTYTTLVYDIYIYLIRLKENATEFLIEGFQIKKKTLNDDYFYKFSLAFNSQDCSAKEKRKNKKNYFNVNIERFQL